MKDRPPKYFYLQNLSKWPLDSISNKGPYYQVPKIWPFYKVQKHSSSPRSE